MDDYNTDPAKTIVNITNIYLEPFKNMDKKTFKELFAMFAESLNKHQDLVNLYLYNDSQYIEFLTKILCIYKEKGILTQRILMNKMALFVSTASYLRKYYSI